MASEEFDNIEFDNIPYEYMENWVAIFVLVGYFMYFLLIMIGIPANIFVLFKMMKFRMKYPDEYSTGTGMCLLTMAMADIFSLFAIFSFCLLSFNFPLPQFVTYFGYVIMCKLTIFTMHTATSIAIWSWLLMSILRWLALYRPLVHRTLYDLPHRMLTVVVTVASVTNCWLLWTVSYDSESHTGCTQSWLFGNETLSRMLLLLEIGWSFFVPIVIVAFLDLSALVTIPRLFTKRFNGSVKQGSMDSTHHTKKYSRTLFRWLFIALVDILLNAPENLRRLVSILGYLPPEITEEENYVIFKTISDILYYSQYSFNAFFLALFIYDKCTNMRKPNFNPNSRQSLARSLRRSVHSIQGESTNSNRILTQKPSLKAAQSHKSCTSFSTSTNV